jgi:hypothetical protein
MSVSTERGYMLVDMIMGLLLFGLVIVSIYHVFMPVFGLSRGANDRLSAQQDIRLAVDRVGRLLHETTLAFGRIRVYGMEEGCTGPYEGCIAFVSARSACAGPFHLLNGAPDWQATVYIWRDVASNELRSRCDSTRTFPVPQWPPAILDPFTVIGTNVSLASFVLQPAGSPDPTSIAVVVRERTAVAPGPGRLRPVDLFLRAVFSPENR